MTSGMDKFMETIKEASSNCTESVDRTVGSLEMINDSIHAVVKKERENATRINSITDELKMVAATTESVESSFEKVADSMSQIYGDIEKFNHTTETLIQMKESLDSTITPISSMESELHEAALRIGKLSKDKYYMMENEIFQNM